MDNASKALVMAGAILIAVMLISLGVLLFNRGQQIADDAGKNINAVAINAYNSRFTAYQGKNKSASDTRSFIEMATAHNNNVEEKGVYGQFTISGNYKTSDKISSSKYYTITKFTYDSNSGAVKGCTISQQSGYEAN